MSASWSDGYFTDTRYHTGYYPEQSPSFQRMCLLLSGHDFPYSPDDTYTCCELGFGQGLTININAAAVPGQWYGNDFNPSHVCFAEKLARASGCKISLCDQSFADFCHRDDLPMFDFVSLHGIWSWISPENREHILHFLNTRVRPGGVVYISYNAHPGMGHQMSIRHLLNQFAHNSDSVQPDQRVAAALQQTHEVFAVDSQLHTVYPSLRKMLETYDTMPPEYLAHEFMNADWECMFFSDVVATMQRARLEYAGKTNTAALVPGLGFSDEAIAYLETVSSPVQREQIADIFCNTAFRRDLFMRGTLPLSMPERIDRLLDMRFALTAPPDTVNLNIDVNMGSVALDEKTHRPFINALAEDNFRPKTLREVLQMTNNMYGEGQIVALAAALCGTRSVAACQSLAMQEKAEEACRKLNRTIVEMASHSAGIPFLASPVLGFGVNIPPINLAFIQAVFAGEDPLKYVVEAARSKKIVFTLADNPNPTEKDFYAAFVKDFEEFQARQPIYAALGLI